MIKCNVYYITSQKRLVISFETKNEPDYVRLLTSQGHDKTLVYDSCKTYCCGFIQATNLKIPIVNDITEFAF